MPSLIDVCINFYNRNTGEDDWFNFRVDYFSFREGNRIKFSSGGNEYHVVINTICYDIDSINKTISSVQIHCRNIV